MNDSKKKKKKKKNITRVRCAGRQQKKRNYAREDARRERSRGFDDAAVAHGLLDAERREHARDYDPDKGVRHPAAGAYAPPKSKSVIDGRKNAWVRVGVGEALRFERERVGVEPVIVKDGPESAFLFLFFSTSSWSLSCDTG